MNEDHNKTIQENSHDLFAVRKAKLDAMRARGEDPFRNEWPQTHTSEQALALFNEETQSGPEVSLAGRIMLFRLMGKASFIKIQDRKGIIQLYFSRDNLPEGKYNDQFKKDIDVGDIIGVKGELFKTKTGEITVRVHDYKMLSKALRPLPEKWHGLTDDDQIYRQRYLDLITNQESKLRFMLRSKIIKEIRQFLWERDFCEVETPILHSVAGGAAAKPFVTYMNALDSLFFLRIAPELYLKRMLVGGFERVFELGRVFRNEGVDRKHNPEFTMLEVYQAYSNHEGMMELFKSMIQRICKNILGTTSIKRPDGQVIELGGEWRQADYKDLIIETTKDPNWFSRTREEKLAYCDAQKIEIKNRDNAEDYEVTNAVYSKQIEPFLVQPTFVMHIQKELCPLAKINQKDTGVLDVFELCINGQEIAPAYSEQNDSIIQRQMLEAQIGEEVQKLDEDFLVAMEHGMPPAGGMGVGIDRLVMLLTSAENIRDTVLFPSLKNMTKDAEDSKEGVLLKSFQNYSKEQ